MTTVTLGGNKKSTDQSGKSLAESREQTLLDKIKEEGDDLEIENTVVTTKDHIAVAEREKRKERLQGMLRPSEKKDFIENIGRTSESDAVRELVLYALGKPTDRPDARQVILDLINKNNA